MRKLVVSCETCGQRMQVPRSAIGKSGQCPSCGAPVDISGNAATAKPRPARKGLRGNKTKWWGTQGTPPEDAKRRFGEAVDLYYSERYAESLAIFNDLAKEYPGNPDIENGRAQCLRTLRRPPARRHVALEDQSGHSGEAGPVPEAKLDEATVRRVVLEKLVAGQSETVQLQAAELAANMLGMLDGRMARDQEESTGDAADTPPEESEPEEPSNVSSFSDLAATNSRDSAGEQDSGSAIDEDPEADSVEAGKA
jgi:hypothetical protein